MSEFAMGDRFFPAQGEPQKRERRISYGSAVDWSSTSAGVPNWYAAGDSESTYRNAKAASSPRASERPESAPRGLHSKAGFAKPRSRSAARDGVEKALAVLLAAIGAAILAAGAFLVLPGLLRVTRYNVTGAVTLNDTDVLRAALVRGNEYFFSIDPEAMRASLLSEPRIADAVVTKVFPNSLSITVKERKAAAIVLVEEDGKLLPVCLDASGVAFAWASDVLPASASGIDLPILSGIRFERFRMGTRLPREFVPAIAAIGEIGESAPALLSAFSEIKLVKPAFGEPELLLFSLHHRVPVRTGAVLNESTLRSIILVLDVLGSRGLADGVKEIDFRTGTVVYRIKEGQSG